MCGKVKDFNGEKRVYTQLTYKAECNLDVLQREDICILVTVDLVVIQVDNVCHKTCNL